MFLNQKQNIKINKSYKVGSVNIRKMLTQLGKFDGSNYIDLITELIDNSFDANAKNITLCIDSENLIISFHDDGDGMDRRDLSNFTELYSEKIMDREKLQDGKFGIGESMCCIIKSWKSICSNS